MEGRGHLRGAGHTWERKGVAGRSSQEQLSGVTQLGGRDSELEAPWTAGCGVGKDERLQSDSCRETWGQSVLRVLCSRLTGCLGAELVEAFLTCLGRGRTWEDNQILSTYRNRRCLQHYCQQRNGDFLTCASGDSCILLQILITSCLVLPCQNFSRDGHR